MPLRRSARVSSKTDNPTQEPPTKKAKTEETQEEVDIEKVSSELEIGDSLPNIELKNQNDESIKISDVVKDHKYVVIFAYPKASTSGCTKQAIGFNNNIDFFDDKNTIVFGISPDSPKGQKSFADKYGFKYDLLSDPKKELISILGAKKKPNGIIRSHFIFVSGKLVDKSVNVKPDDSYNNAKKEIEKLEAGDNDKDVKEEKDNGEQEDVEKKEKNGDNVKEAKENEDSENKSDRNHSEKAANDDKEAKGTTDAKGEGEASSKIKEAEDREADNNFEPANGDEPAE
ncbi:unnamed protein product [Candida verbasci]|uniref:thioredoxin-dependent peroxiredoxin n=1 Tax=Candida verbasci TaxID=1227364 RepID=A0A9W4TV60_9ASCO|nr:unnamed protein product [Candida verbasci]